MACLAFLNRLVVKNDMVAAKYVFLNTLRTELQKAQKTNPSFSQRAFAKKLGISPATLCGILANKLPITRKTADKLLTAFNLQLQDYEKHLATLKYRENSGEPFSKHYINLDMEYFKLISDWYYFAILELVETEGFRSDHTFIAKRLGISTKTVQNAIRRLSALKLVRVTKDGDISPTGISYKTSSQVPNLHVRKNNRDGLDLALKNMRRPNFFEESDYSAITMAIDPSKLPEAKIKIRNFRRQLCSFLEKGKRKEVYRINLQLFPLTISDSTNQETKL